MGVNTTCDVKRLYDTQFEADIAAARASYDFGTEMVSYQCGGHWHIANKLKQNRSKTRTENKTWCEVCQSYIRSGGWDKHARRPGHIAKLSAQEKGPQ